MNENYLEGPKKSFFEKWKKEIFVGALVVIAFSILGIKYYFTCSENNKLEKKIDKLESQLDAAIRDDLHRIEVNTEQIFKELKASSDLATYTYEYKNKTAFEDTRILPFLKKDIWATTNRVDIEYSGIINVGYDMNQIEYKLATTPIGNEIHVTLPKAEVLDNYIKFDDLVCVCENNILNPIRTDKVMKVFEDIEAEELAKAESDNIYEKANDQLKSIVTRYFSVLPNYKVVFN